MTTITSSRPGTWPIAAPGYDPRPHRRQPANPLLRMLSLLAAWQDRANQRDVLGSLDDRMLKDIGLSRADALQEARKPFWRA